MKALDSTLNESSGLFSMIRKWAAEFKHSWTSTFDDEHSGHPSTATIEETMTTHNAIINNWQL